MKDGGRGVAQVHVGRGGGAVLRTLKGPVQWRWVGSPFVQPMSKERPHGTVVAASLARPVGLGRPGC